VKGINKDSPVSHSKRRFLVIKRGQCQLSKPKKMAMGDKVTIEALDVENYGTWCIRMKALLIHKKL
jgi:hypothetical protein